MKYLINESTDPYFNMAFDEFCLENLDLGEPYFYLWRNRPSVIIGLNQNAYTEVNMKYLEDNGIALVRRVTGGGAVYHDLQNMNYTIIGKGASPEPMVAALRSLGVPAELTGRNDIFVDGKKVSGYARRVSRNHEIIHGTLMYDVDISTLSRSLDTPESKLHSKGIASVKSRVANLKDCLQQFSSLDELQARLQELLAGGDERIFLNDNQIEEIRSLAETKFGSWDFIYGHSHEADFTRSAALPCGTVTASIIIDRGLIKGLSFSGDFMFADDPAPLAASLIGLRYDRSSVLSALQPLNPSRFFPGSAPEQIAELIVG